MLLKAETAAQSILHELVEITEREIDSSHPSYPEFQELVEFARGEYVGHEAHRERMDILIARMNTYRSAVDGFVTRFEAGIDPDSLAGAFGTDTEAPRCLGSQTYTGDYPDRPEWRDDDRFSVARGDVRICDETQSPVSSGFGYCKGLVIHNPLSGQYAYAHVLDDLTFDQRDLITDLGPGVVVQRQSDHPLMRNDGEFPNADFLPIRAL
ncbi:hypothetical protein ACFL6C_10750, partial [Myxococcota bacterium]